MDDNVQYQDWAMDTVACYYQGLGNQKGQPQAAVSYALDQSITGWTEYPISCVATVIPLSIISVREGFLPDYLEAMLARLRDISDLLAPDEVIHYRDDLRTLEVLMKHIPYEVTRGDAYWDEVARSIPASVSK